VSALLSTFAASGRIARAELRACAAERNRLATANAELLAINAKIVQEMNVPSTSHLQLRRWVMEWSERLTKASTP